jgi:hypothetical protein
MKCSPQLTLDKVGPKVQLDLGSSERNTAACSPMIIAPEVRRTGMIKLLPGSNDDSAQGPSTNSCTMDAITRTINNAAVFKAIYSDELTLSLMLIS